MEKNEDEMEKVRKKQKTENWSEEGKTLLKDLIKKEVNQIENKNTDTNTSQRKKEAWLDVERDFNSLCSGAKRSVPQLKSQWAGLKIQAKREVSDYRKERRRIGGGPPPENVSLSGNDIAAWLPEEFVINENGFDSDCLTPNRIENVMTEYTITHPKEDDEIKKNEEEKSETSIKHTCKK